MNDKISRRILGDILVGVFPERNVPFITLMGAPRRGATHTTRRGKRDSGLNYRPKKKPTTDAMMIIGSVDIVSFLR
jgi:hypothetical protein